LKEIPQLRPEGVVTVKAMAGSSNSSFRARWALFVAAVLTCALAAPASAPAATGGAGVTPRDTCPVLPGSFSAGPGAANFTMLIRINQMDNVKTYTNFNSATGGLGGRIRQQDIFVINTRFEQTTPSVAEQIASSLRTAFPCNRIIALNGLNPNATLPGYVYTLLNSPSYIYAMLLDYEPMDWAEAQAQGSALPPFTLNFRPNLPRMGYFLGPLSGNLGTLGIGTRAGVAPFDQANWNYGQVAQTADAYNTRLGARHLGLQSVQTQSSCQAGATAFANRAAQIRDTYKFRIKIKKKKVHKGRKIVKKKIRKRVKIKKAAQANLNNLALQVSFNDTPVPGDPMPIKAVGPTLADQCVAAALAKGQSNFFFFASDTSMKLLYQQPTVNSLRPPLS
jgi:hypothetical protein